MNMFDKFEDEELDKELMLVNYDMKFLFDLAYASFFHIFEKEGRDKYIIDLTDNQARQIIKWFETEYIPLYEGIEEFEKCAKLKEAIDIIKKVKKWG